MSEAYDDDDFPSIDTANYDVKSSGFVDAAGVYQFGVMEWKKEGGNGKAVAVVFELQVQHSVEGQSPAGSKLYHRIYLTQADGSPPKEGSVTSAVNFFCGVGVMKRETRDGKEVGVSLIDGTTRIGRALFDAACNRLCWGEIRENKPKPVELAKYPNAKSKYELPFGQVHQLDNPKFCRNPGDDVAAEIVGYVRVNGAYQKQGTEAPKTVATAPKSSAYSDL